MKSTIEIYNEIKKKRGKLAEFSKYLVEHELYKDVRSANQALRFGTGNLKIAELYADWKVGKVKTMDMSRHNDKLKGVFKDIKTRGLKQDLTDIRDVLEHALMELTLGIKNNNKEQLLQVKAMLQDAIYA